MNGCIHLCTTRRTFFYSRIFRKRTGTAMIFGVSLYLPIIFTNVPGRGDKSTPLNCSSKKEVDLPERSGRKQSGGWNGLLEQIAFPLFSTCIGTSSELSVIWKFKLFPTRNVSRSSAQADQFQDGVR